MCGAFLFCRDAKKRRFPVDVPPQGFYIRTMPYTWTETTNPPQQELRLWPHQSLPRRGFAAFILATFSMATIPLYPLLGTVLLWGLLPFLLLAVAGLWIALERNRRDAEVLEVLKLSAEEISLTRHNPRGPDQSWQCNAYWAQAHLHERHGPVPHYVTLRGGGREVEIGAFLSEDERKALYDDLTRRIARHGAPN